MRFHRPGVNTAGFKVSLAYVFRWNGVYYLEDGDIGDLVKEVDDEGLSASLESWKRLKAKLLGDAKFQPILELLQNVPDPKICYTFGSDPGHIFCFWPLPDLARLPVVSIWSKKSSAEFYNGSHKGEAKAVPASNGLFEVPRAIVGKNWWEAVVPQMEEGGIAILDARFMFQVKAGFMVTYGFKEGADQDVSITLVANGRQ
ncbi:hypothetical protein QBC44DRAFT_391084 [Cladorrhinum sp. PSN332]|nr:hypothetical protein QBC44DRAFT_391084 [Cladorrhinum sp. PSN332]